MKAPEEALEPERHALRREEMDQEERRPWEGRKQESRSTFKPAQNSERAPKSTTCGFPNLLGFELERPERTHRPFRVQRCGPDSKWACTQLRGLDEIYTRFSKDPWKIMENQ